MRARPPGTVERILSIRSTLDCHGLQCLIIQANSMRCIISCVLWRASWGAPLDKKINFKPLTVTLMTLLPLGTTIIKCNEILYKNKKKSNILLG